MEEGKHDFSGQCAPKGNGTTWSTFSVGVFQWLPKAGGIGVKRSAVKVRVKGSSSNPEKVYDKAEEIVAALDAGTYTGKRNVIV